MKKDRIFKTKDKDDNELVLRFKRPTQNILSKAELQYRVIFSQAFTANILTNAQVDKALKARGIWDDKSENEAAEMRTKIINLEEKLQKNN